MFSVALLVFIKLLALALDCWRIGCASLSRLLTDNKIRELMFLRCTNLGWSVAFPSLCLYGSVVGSGLWRRFANQSWMRCCADAGLVRCWPSLLGYETLDARQIAVRCHALYHGLSSASVWQNGLPYWGRVVAQCVPRRHPKYH